MASHQVGLERFVSRDSSISSDTIATDGVATASGASSSRIVPGNRSTRAIGSRSSARNAHHSEGTAPEEMVSHQLEAKWNSKILSEARHTYKMSTGLCYDRRMTSHCILDGEHPEDPKRISAIYTIIVRNGLVNDPELSGASNPEDPGLMVRIEAREATKREICLIHDRDQFEFAQRLEDLDDDELINLTRDADSVYFNQYTFICAKLSCGGVIETCLRVAQGHLKNAIAVVRPPGHHATPHNAMGFCIFNNVCVAAKVLQARVPSVKKILILDWDIHHGNGTQDAFYSDPSVLYISLHRFEKGNFYPNDPKGDSKFCGKDQGTGFNVNIPWTEGGKLDGDYLWAFQKLVMPIALEYNPDFVIVSAGFDAAAGDELGECYITPVGFAHMTHMLMGLAKGKMAVCLEGGYNLSSISDSALAVIKVLMGQAPEKLLEPPVASPAAAKVVQECINIQMRYWRCLYSAGASVRGNGLSLNVRAWQEKILWEKYKITKVPIMHPSRLIYENAVLMSENCITANVIVLLVHEPPKIHATVDTRGSKELDLDDLELIDPTYFYIRWAFEKQFGIIDVSLPPRQPSKSNGATQSLREQSESLCDYLWDNYIELQNAEHILLVGVEEGVSGLIHMLQARRCEKRVKALVGFICAANMQSILYGGIKDQALAEWYFNSSLLFVGSDHLFWENNKSRRRKYGNCKLTAGDVISTVMLNSQKDATDFMMNKVTDEASDTNTDTNHHNNGDGDANNKNSV